MESIWQELATSVTVYANCAAPASRHVLGYKLLSDELSKLWRVLHWPHETLARSAQVTPYNNPAFLLFRMATQPAYRTSRQ